MKKFFKIFLAKIRQSLNYDMQYRTNFFVNSFASFGWAFLSYLIVIVIGSNVDSIRSYWLESEYLLIWAIFNIAETIVNTISKRSVEKIPDLILKGNLDSIITKPFNSKILSSIGYIRFELIPSLIFEFFIAIKSIKLLSNSLNIFWNLTIFLILVILTSTLYYSLIMIIISFVFWLVGAYNILYLFQSLMQFGNYPINSFGKIFRILFSSLFPIYFLGHLPAEIIIHNSFIKIFIIVALTLIFYKISDKIWHWGLGRYESASS